MAIRDQKTIRKRSLSELELCSAMARLSSLALSENDPDRIISEALKEIRKTLGARICWMFLVEEDRTILKGLGDAGSRRGPAKSELLLKLSPKILKRTYPIICNRIEKLYEQNRTLYRFLRQRDIEKFMGVPLNKDGRSIGVLNLGRGRDAKDFTREDLQSLTMLGSVLVVSRLRAAERESRQAQSFLEGIIDNIPNPVFIKDRKHHWVVLNRAFSELVGHSREKMLGKSDHDFFPKNQADFFWKKDEEMFRTGKVVDIPVEPVTGKDGDLHHLHTKKAPLKDSSGKITHLVGIIDDISDRLQSESALRESEQKYRLLVENIKEGIYSVHQGRFTNVNESMCRMFGYSKEEMVGMASWSLAVPEKRDSVRELFFAKATKRDFSPTEIECVRKDGSVFVAEIRLSSITGRRHFLGVVSDVTQRKRAGEALRESESRYRAVFEGAAEGILVADIEKRKFRYANPAICKMLGYTEKELTGMGVKDIHPEHALKDAISEFDAHARRPRALASDMPCLRKDGRIIRADIHTATVLIDGRMCNVGFFTDTTERRQIGAALIQKERVARERARVLVELHKLNQIEDILTRVCTAVRDSGLFERAVMTLHEPGGRICHMGQVGLPAGAVRRAQRAAPVDRELKKSITSKKFCISDSFFVPSEAGLDFSKSGRHIPQKKTGSVGGDWRPGDELFVPLRDFSGKIMGYMSVDTPTDGCRPDVKTVQSLEMLVEAAASRIREVRAQKALMESEERHRHLVENLTDMIVEFDREGHLLFVSPSYCQTFGKSEHEILGKKFMPLIHRDDREKVKRALAGIYQPPHIAYVEERAQTVDGWRWQSWVNTAVLDQKGNIVRIVAVGRDITEQKRADEALQRSEDRYRSLFEDSPISLWEEDFSEVKKYIDRLRESGIVDFSTYFDRHPKAVAKCASMVKVIDVNKASLKLYKARDKEELKSGLAKIFATESYYPFTEELIAVAEGKTRFEKEADARTLKGDKRRVSVTWSVAPGYEETLSKIVVAIADVTEAKKAEEALRESEEKYRGLFATVPDAIMVFDAKTRQFVDVNDAALNLYGYSRNEFLKLKHPNITAEPEASDLSIKSALAGDLTYIPVRYHKKKSGSVFPVDISAGVFTFENRRVICGVIRDITQRKKAEEALRREEERYRTLVETAQEGIGIADSKENLVFVNRAFAQLLGYRRDELLGKNLAEISNPAQYEFFKEETRRRQRGQSSKYEITLLTKRGKPKPMYVSAAPLWNPDGSFRGTLGVVSDLTEIKKAREYNILLGASRSLSRTLKFDQVLKLGAEKMAQALSADRCAVMLPEDDFSGSSIQVQVYPFPNKGKDSLSAWNLKTTRERLSSYKRSLQARGSIQIPNLQPDLDPHLGKKIVRKSGMISALVVPMFLRNTMLGVFHVGMRKKVRAFSLEEERLARTMANQVAVALQNCTLIDDLQREHSRIVHQSELLSAQFKEQKMMFELTQTLSSSRNLDQLLASAARKVTEFLNTERGSVALLGPGGDSCSVRAIHVRGTPRPRSFEGATFTFEVHPGLKDVVLKHRPFVLPDSSLLSKEDPGRKYFLSRGIKSTVAVPLLSRGKCLGFLTASTVTDVHRYTKEEIRLLQTISNPVAVTIENYRLLEDLKQKYAQIEDQATKLKKQTREKDILLKVGRALSRTMDLDEVGRVASQVVGSTLGVERCAITLVTNENYELELKGLYLKDRAQDRKLIGTKFLWNDVPDMCNMIKRRKPFVIQNTSDFYPEGKTKEYFLKAGIKSVLGTGMFFGDKLVGILSITSTKKHQTFSHEEVKLVQTLANQIGVAIENARLQEVIEKHTKDLKDLYSQLLKTQENERKRITQELHDQVGQMLQSMKMNLGRIKRNLGSKPPCLEGIEDSLLDTEELLGQTIEDIRTLTLDLSPPMLVDFGLIPTLRWFIENYGKRSGIKLSLKTKDKAYRFPQEVEFTLYRIIQEAVTNVAKHAKATEASVSISRKDSTAVLSVRDNGVGFDAAGVLSAPTGMGLLNIKERVDLLGGTFEIISRPRKGTKLNIQIPFSGGAV